MDESPALARGSGRRAFRLGVVLASAAVAIVGSVLLATRHTEKKVTTQGVTATLQVASHPGWVVAGRNAVWLAVNGERDGSLGERPIERLDLATGLVQRAVSVGGEASYVTRVGNRLIASVRHVGQSELGGRIVFALDWNTGQVLVQRGFDGPVDHIVASGGSLWALEGRPGALLRLDPTTLAPTTRPLSLSSGRTADVAAGAGQLWVTAPDTGEILRVDPASRAVTRIDVGGNPTGIAVTDSGLWYADPERGDVGRRDVVKPDDGGTTVHLGGRPTWLTAAGRTLFVSDAASGTVTRIDLRSGKRVGLPIRIAPAEADAVPFAMTPSDKSVWVSSYTSNTLTRVSSPSPGPIRNVVALGAEPSQDVSSALPPGGRVVATIPLVPGSAALAVGEGAVWALTDADSTLLHIDPGTDSVVARVDLTESGGQAGAAAAGAGAVWISYPVLGTVSRLDPSTNEITATIHAGREPAGIAVTSHAVWVADIGGPSVTRIDPSTNRVVATIRVGPAPACCAEHMSLTATKDAVWVAVPNANTIVRIDPGSNTVTDTVKLRAPPCALVVADERSVWNASGGCGDVLARVDARTKRLATIVQGEPHPIGLGLFDGSLWVAANHSSSIDRVDPETGRLTARLPVGGLPVLLDVGFGSIWVTDDEGRLLRIEPQD